MASIKTVEFAGTALASLTDSTLTAVTMPTIYLPESSKTFRSVIAKITMDDIVTVTGASITSRRLDFQLAAVAANSTINTNTITNSGENLSLEHVVDLTAYFTTNWTGSSMTCNASVLSTQTGGTTLGMVNVCITLEITYEYDDTSTTQIKTVWIPLDALTTASGLAKPGTATAVIPALDTYLPEASKTYRNIHIVVQGNEHRNTTVDHTMTLQIDTLTAVTTGNYEGALATDRWFRYVWNIAIGFFTSNATHDFFLWASVSKINHPQVYMVVTYEYNDSTTTSVMNSLWMPARMDSPIGGTTSSDYQRSTTDLWIQEPGTITLQRLAFLFFYQGGGVITGLSCRIGTGSFIAYTDNVNVTGGNMGLMVRDDGAFTLARGKNTLTFDAYRTATAYAQLGWTIGGVWLVNYTSGKATGGTSKHNKSVKRSIYSIGTSNGANLIEPAAVALNLPDTNYFITNMSCWAELAPNGTLGMTGYNILVERLAGEGGIKWEEVFADTTAPDPEYGTYFLYREVTKFHKRYSNDPDTSRFDLTTARRYKYFFSAITVHLYNMGMCYTYHGIATTLSGTISGSSGGTVTIKALRPSTLEVLAETSRTGNGSYSITVYDGTNDVVVVAYESDSLKGASKQDPAGSSFDISLSGGSSSAETGSAYA